MAHQRHIVESEQRRFREMLITISQDLRENELETLKFYCSEFIPTARREDIDVPTKLWEAIMEKGRMSSTDTRFLQELLEKAIQRNDLLDIVVQYANHMHVPSHTGLIHEFEFIAENVNLRKWRHLVRTLGVTDADIDMLAEQYHKNIREQVLRALLLWESRSMPQATRAVLIDALRNCELRLLADKLENIVP